MRKLPTDLKILNSIYGAYYETFASYSKEQPTRSSKIYVPIEIDRLAEKLGVDKDIVFGRLYYHLEKKFGYEQDDGSMVHLFALRAGDETHCVHFPYLASVLADLRSENKKFRIVTTIAIISLIVAAVSLAVSFLT